MKKILIFEANSNQALAISKYIKKYSEYYIVGCIENKVRFNVSNYDEVIIKSYLDVDISQYDFVLPMGANSSYQVVSYYKQLKYCNEIQFTQSNLIVFDKPKMLDIAKELNVPIPNTFYRIDEIDKFPVFYKENFENGGGVRGVAHIVDEIPTAKHLIYQEHINTPSTYGVGFLAKDGEILTCTLHKEIISYPIEGGSSVVIEKFEDKRLIDYTKIMLKKLKYNGWGLAEYKYCDKRDDFIFMEINAKFWASIEFMLANNNHLLFYLLDVNYASKNIMRMVFINRFLRYTIQNIVTNGKYLFFCLWIKESSVLYQLVRKMTPHVFVRLIKRYVK